MVSSQCELPRSEQTGRAMVLGSVAAHALCMALTQTGRELCLAASLSSIHQNTKSWLKISFFLFFICYNYLQTLWLGVRTKKAEVRLEPRQHYHCAAGWAMPLVQLTDGLRTPRPAPSAALPGCTTQCAQLFELQHVILQKHLNSSDRWPQDTFWKRREATLCCIWYAVL